MAEAPHITAIKASKRDPMRASVHVDGKSVGTLLRTTISDLGLTIDLLWTSDLATRFAAAVDFDRALRDALRLLNRRAYSSGELRDRLSRREHDGATLDHLLEHLRSNRMVDDLAYGRSVISQALAKKPAGRRFLQNKLYQKRLPRDIIEQLLNETQASRDAVEDAVKLAEARLRTPALQRCDAATRRRRLWGLLCRRGFDGQTAMAALDRLHLMDDESGHFPEA